MPEAILGLVPNLVLDRLGIFAMLVTSERIILLPGQQAKTLLGDLADAGAVKTKGWAKAEGPFSPEAWSRCSGAIAIPHGAILRVGCHRTINTYWLSIEYTSAKGPRKLTGFLLPSRTCLRTRKREGVPPAETAMEYAVDCGDILRRADRLAAMVDWRL